MADTMDGKSTGEKVADSLKKVPETVQGSQAWNSIFRPGSIFRNGYTDSPRNRSYVIMNSVLYHLHPVKVKRHAVKVSYTLCLGGLSFFLFILLTVTGIFLMFFYRPTAAQAWNDIYTLQTSVAFGLLVRNMHRWAAHLMVLSVFLHMARVFYHGAYKPPLGGHGGHEHDGLHTRLREPGALRAAGRRRDRHRHVAALVRAARADAPVRDRDLHGHPLLAGSQGWRHLRAPVGQEDSA